MANHGAKFVSVNLNKSYGQQHQSSHHSHYPHFNGGGGSYGQAAAGRGRGGGGGGGMLVLSRNRGGAPKVAPKLSIPPPLNLPSLRKEHEKFDMSGPGGPGASAGTGSGSRPSSSGVGWSKPISAATALPEKNEGGLDTPGVDGTSDAPTASRGIGSYMPPSARSNGAGGVGFASASRDFVPSAEKVLLRGEDFPSLQAVRPVSSGASQKQKEGLNQKQKQVLHEELTQDKEDGYHLGPMADMHPPGLSSGITGRNRSVDNGGAVPGMVGGRRADHIRKPEEYFPDPLPLVRMNPRSDWADDERDTGHGFVEQGRDAGFSNSENYWDRDFDLPRPSILPHKPAANKYDRWGQRDNEAGKNFSSEVLKTDPYNKDVRTPSREGMEVNRWRTSVSKDGVSSQEIGNHRVDIGARMAGNNVTKENKYVPPHYGDTVRDGSSALNRDSAFGRRDLGHVGQQTQRNSSIDSFNNRGTDRNSRDRHVSDQPNRYRGDNFQNNTSSRPFIASSGRRPPISDPILTMGRDKRFSSSDRPFPEDPFSRDFSSAGFDERDLFSDGLVGVIKRKKDAAKPTDFHDPIRESFEAELERVQKMQELERQRIIDEQERALEQARREEEERLGRIREEEDRRQRLEDEAREATWRAEQEQLETIRKAEELRISREEGRKRMQLEEERRKQAAKQMLQELEAKMAKRQAETGDASASRTIVDENLKEAVKENPISRNVDLETWEDSERMVENVMASGSFESSAHGRPAEMSSRPYPPRESSSNFMDKGKSINSWKRDVLEYGSSFPSPLSEQETGHYSPRRDALAGGRAGPRKELHGGPGSMPSRAYLKAGVQESYSDEFGYQKEQRWNLSGNADSYGKLREMDLEFPDIADRYGDSGWGQGRTRNGTRPPYPERLYPHSDANELYAYGRSRYSDRQPRVPPPPSLTSAQRNNIRGVSEHSGPSTFLDGSIHYTHASRTESASEADYYGTNHGGPEPSEIFGMHIENSTSERHKLNSGSRCDSQSSLSVSSPPTSPPHLSQDELDVSGDSPVASAVAEGKSNLVTGAGSGVHNDDSGNNTLMIVSDSVSAAEDEEWTLENEDVMQQQEEYDEDEDGYREEDEVRDRDVENLELNQKFDGLELEERDSPRVMDNVVLGFDEGIEVEIPSDDIEKSIENQERSFGMHAGSVGMVEERVIGDGFTSGEQNLLTADDSCGASADRSSGKVLETSAVPGSIGQHVGMHCSAATELVDGADSSGNTCLAAHPTVSSSSADVTVLTSQPSNLSSVPSAGSPGDLPIKLQFGLFSGPSLIPSPVPAIQIGSIQMPLHIHPPVGPSITHMHPSQPPMFQFGQLRYTSPISQGILPMAPQSMSFVQPNMLGHLNLNQNVVNSGTHEPARDVSRQNTRKDEVASHSINNQPSFVSTSSELSNGGLPSDLNSVSKAENHNDNSVVHASSVASGPCDDKLKSGSRSHFEEKGHHHAASKSYLPSSKARGYDNQSHHVQPMMHSVAGEKNYGVRGLGAFSGGRGRRFAYAVKNANARSSIQDQDMPADSYGFQRRQRRTVQRTEFRIRESNDRRPAPAMASFSAAGSDKSTYTGKAGGGFGRSGAKRGSISNRTMKHRIESEPLVSGSTISQEVDSGDRTGKEVGKDLSSRNQNASHSGEANLRRNVSEEDVDAPLQSGVVRVYKQPGIEAPSDEDDFIEVRSKRQMLNDRREQREKEIKAKSRIIKPPRKPRPSRQSDVVTRSNHKHSVPLGSVEVVDPQLEFSVSESSHFVSGGSTGFTAAVSQPPIGTPPVNSEPQAIKPPLSGSASGVSNSRTEREPGLFDSKNKVMSLSQTQIDEAMKPARYDSRISSVGDHSSPVNDPILPSSSILTKDKTFSSGSSPINSLLAGEKIQFGAVTSPTIIPPTSRVVSHGIGAPGSNRPDVQVSRNFPVTEKDNSLFFEKEKQLNDSCVPLQDCEAEAEAAASAVAVAAISSDEIVGNSLRSVNDKKSFSGADIDGITTGVVRDQHMASQSQGEELSVSLPADLSIETTPISLWPPLPSPQSSTSQMLSHFPAGPPSHFPFYEMNPLLGGPIFAFSPHEEPSGTQPHPPKTTSSSSVPLGNWQQCHSGVDSFYGPPAGYSGPFIGPPGGIPGVQGPPHMVVYNHFAPVGQYGQVGLSFMGTTYIPSGKQADWKNSASSTAMHIGDGDINNVNMTTVQRSAPISAPIQHLAPGSPLLPMPPPMPLFDVSPFPTAPDLPVQARWGHIPASPLHSVSVSRPLQPQVEGALPSQANHGHSIEKTLAAKRFTESRTPTPSDNGPSFTVAADTNVGSFPTELGLVDSLRSSTSPSGQTAGQSLSGSTNAESGKTDTIDSRKQHQSASSVKSQFSKKNMSTQQGNNTTGLYYQRSHAPHRNNTGNELPHRRMGFHGRGGVDRSFPPASKIKQIYVAKQTTTGNSST